MKNQRKTGRSTRTRRQKDQTDIPAKIPRLIQNGQIVHGFPDKLVTSVRYHQTGAFTSTAGALNSVKYRWNSTFAPSVGGGHQPLYRDTYASLYDHYSVISATVIVKIINTSATTFIVGIGTDDDTTLGTAIDTVCEQKHGQSVLLPPLTGSLMTHTFTATWNCKDILNIDPFSSQTYKTAVGSDPSEESILSVFGAATAGTAAVEYDVLLTQTVLWTELSTPTQS